MSHRLKPTIAVIILVSIISFSLLQPLSAQAQQVGATSVTSALIGGGICTVSGFLSNWLVGQITTGIGAISDWLWNNGFKRFGFTLVNATVPINDPANDTRITVMDVAARCFARELLNDLTARITGAARTGGRDSSIFRQNSLQPSFIRDWRRFLTNAQHRGENIFRAMLGSSAVNLCQYVAGDLRTAYKATNQPLITKINTRVNNFDSFAVRANCTMPRGWSMSNYRRDFAGNGGWGSFSLMGQQQNNFYGSFILAMSEAAVQRGIEEMSDDREGGAGDGFTSRRGKPDDTCLIPGVNECLVYKDILTPGSIIGDAVSATITEELAWITNVDQWNEIIQYVMTTLMSRVLNLAQPSDYDQELFGPEKYPSPYDRNFSQNSFGSGGGVTPGPTPPSNPQCSDGQDNDSDGFVDFPADLGCDDLLDNDETGTSPFNSQVRLCTDVNFGGSCWTLGVGNYTVPVSGGIPAGSSLLPIPDDTLSSGMVTLGLEADICSGANYVSCYTITGVAGRAYDTSIGTSGNGVPADWPGANDSASSVRIRSTLGPTPTPSPGPSPKPPVTQCTAGGSTCLTVQYFPIGQNPACLSGGFFQSCLVVNYQIASADITGGYTSGAAQIYVGSYPLGPAGGITGSALASGTIVFLMPSPTPATYNITLFDGPSSLGTQLLVVSIPIP